MSLPTPLLQGGVALVVGAIIRANTGGDKTKEAARATEALTIITALQELNNGDVAGGVAAIQAALQTKVLDPAESIALNSFLSFASTYLTAAVAAAGGTILGQVDSAIAQNVLNEAAVTAKAYVPSAS